MAFGFVVVKFSLFVKQISLILGKENMIHSKGYSGILGIALVGNSAYSEHLISPQSEQSKLTG
jgi:putative membrane protein